MQKITIEYVKGPLGKGERKFYAIKADGIKKEFTSFDTKFAQYKPGTVLEIEAELSGDYVNIKEGWKVISEPSSASAVDSASMAHEYMRRIEMDIDARYRISALEAGVSLAVAGKISSLEDIKLHADQYYCWLTEQTPPVVRAGAPTPPVNKGEPKATAVTGSERKSPAEPEAGKAAKMATDQEFEKLGRTAAEKPGAGSIDPRTLVFANAGEFYAACLKHRGYNKTEVDKELRAKYNLAHPAQRAEAWQFILGLPAKNKVGN